MDLTRFENLEASIRRLGGNKIPGELVEALQLGVKDTRPEDVVVGDHGVYYLSDDGVLTRVLVNIVDKAITRRYMRPDQLTLLRTGDYDNDTLVESLHRYHFLRCKTIENAEKQGWRDKYKMSHRSDGRFYYRFLEKNVVRDERHDQRLYACKNCLAAARAAGSIDSSSEPDTFDPGRFLQEQDDNASIGLQESGEFAEQSVPNKYARDWRLIATALKRKKGFRCQGLGCPRRDLSDPRLRKFLHAHHVDMDKTNNSFSNLEALCIRCHAEQPGHEHMKTTHDYRDYMATFRRKAPTVGN